MYYDIHTHNLHEAFDILSILNLSPEDFANQKIPDKNYSIGLHPWLLKATDLQQELELLKQLSVSPAIKAIGECGLDKRCAVSFSLQEEAFHAQIKISEEVKKPLIIHCVKAFDEVIAFKKQLKPAQKWIIHGFRGKPEQVFQLLKQDFYFSIGYRFNSSSLQKIPLDRLFLETDDEDCDIRSVYKNVQEILQLSEEMLIGQIKRNVESYLLET